MFGQTTDSEWLTPHEAANVLRISTEALRQRMVREPERYPRTKVGHRVLLERAAIDRLLREGAVR